MTRETDEQTRMLRLKEKSNRMYRCTVLCTRRDEGGVKDEGSSQYHNKGLFRVLISVCKIINFSER